MLSYCTRDLRLTSLASDLMLTAAYYVQSRCSLNWMYAAMYDMRWSAFRIVMSEDP